MKIKPLTVAKLKKARKQMLLLNLQTLWEEHDALEREIIKLERNFTDDELDELL